MNVSVSEITNAVLMLLDENRALLETRLTYCDPGTDLISLARRLLPEAARLESAEAAPGDISEGLPLEAAVRYDADSVATAELPDDFQRLLYLRMSDWSGGLTQTLSPSGASVPLLRATAQPSLLLSTTTARPSSEGLIARSQLTKKLLQSARPIILSQL